MVKLEMYYAKWKRHKRLLYDILSLDVLYVYIKAKL